MAEIAPPPQREAPRSPEPLRFQEGLVGLQTRLLITTPEALNPDSELPAVTSDVLGNFADRNYGVFNNASTGERQDYWRGKEGDVFDRQKAAWIKSTVDTFTSNQAKAFFQTEKGKRWSVIFGRLKITVEGFNQQGADTLYSTYFSGGTSDIKKFVKDCIDKDATEDITAIQWIANIFGKESSEVIAQMVDAEKKLKDHPDQLVAEANEEAPMNNQPKGRVNRLEQKERKILEFLSGETQHQTNQQTQRHVIIPDAKENISPDVLLQTTIYSQEKDRRTTAFEEAWKQRWNTPKHRPHHFETEKTESPFSAYSSKGWKIHLAFEKGKEKEMAKFLYTNGLYFKLQGLMGTYFDGNKASGSTIYIGSHANMTAIAEYIEQNVGQFLVNGRPMTVGGKVIYIGSGSDMEVRPNISARFDVQKTQFGVMGGNKKYEEYGISTWTGFGGMPLLSKYTDEVLKLENMFTSASEFASRTPDERKNALERLKQIYEESKAEAIKDFGEEFLLGKTTQETNPRRVRSFKTAKGSVYTYDQDGKTTRFKTATGEAQARQDMTVFVDLTPDEDQEFLHAYHHVREEDKDSKVYVLERQPDDTPKILRDISEAQNPDRIYLGIIKNGVVTSSKKASVKPVIGYQVFDTRQFRKNGQTITERHLGNKVVDIQYENS